VLQVEKNRREEYGCERKKKVLVVANVWGSLFDSN